MPKKLTQEEFIEKARKVHGDKYDYSKVEYVNNRTKVCIICPIHGEFWQRPNDFLSMHGCPKCGVIKRSQSHLLTQSDFIERANIVHNNKYKYLNVKYENSKSKVEIVCPTHGVFLQSPIDHLNGHGCPKCKSDNLKKQIYGFGINDLGITVVKNQSYKFWRGIIKRCYDKNYQSRQPTYIGCTVCDEWKYLSSFKEWFDANYVNGWQLDKDILVKGNKVYSPSTCCFVPREINTIFSPNAYTKSNHVGVVCDNGKQWRARIGINKKLVYSKHFNTKGEAIIEYIRMKKERAIFLANKYKKSLSTKVYLAICKYDLWLNYETENV